MATDEYTFSIAKPTNNHIYIDPVNGNDANDGLDPLGLSLTNASYVESTGILTEVGAFAGLVLDGEQYDTDTADILYLVGHGRARIAEKISDDAVRIDDRWKLGSDQTGLTSSNGPKQTIVTNIVNNTEYHIKAGDYEIAAPVEFGQKTGQCGLYFYGGDGRLYSNTIADTSYLVRTGAVNGTIPAKTTISNCELDAQYIQNLPIFSGIGMTNTESHYRTILRHVVQKNSKGDTLFNPGTAEIGARMDFVLWGGNLYNRLETPTSTRSQSMYSYSNADSTLRAVGVISDNDSLNDMGETPLTRHHWYQNGYNNNFHAAWCYFRSGAGSNFSININTSKLQGEWTRFGISVHDCYMGASERGLDFSNHSGTDIMYIDNIYVARVQARINNDFAFPARAKSAFFTDIDHESIAGKQSSATFNITAESTWNYTFQRVRTYNSPFLRMTGSFTVEAYDCESINLTTDVINYHLRSISTSEQIAFVDNKFYAPNAPNTDHYQIDGVRGPLSTLNALTLSSNNTEGVISWADWPPVLLNEIAFSNAVANGTTGSTTSTEITLTFDEDPTGLAATDITVTGATKGLLSGTGTTRLLTISDITVLDGETINIAIADNNGNTFSPNNRDVTVFVAAAGRLYLNPANDTAALLSFDLGADNNSVYSGQGLRFKIITSDVTTNFGGGLTGNSSNTIQFRPTENSSNGVIELQSSYAYSTLAQFQINIPSRSLIWDGFEHSVDIPVVANDPVIIKVDGTSYSHASESFSSVPRLLINYIRGNGTYYIYDIEVYDIATSTVLLKFDVDSGTLVGTEAASVGTGTLTLNVSEGDWTDTPT